MKPNINSVEVHPQVSNDGHPVDGALVGAGSLGPPLHLGESILKSMLLLPRSAVSAFTLFIELSLTEAEHMH